jgi:hypothetical protein
VDHLWLDSSMMNRPTIGVRLPSWAGSTTQVLGGIVDYMRLHSLWRLETENDSYGEMEHVKIGVGWQGDGLILYRATQDELEDFQSRGIAVVLLSTEGPDGGYPRVLPDNFEAGKLAAEHLLGLGLKSFAFLARGATLYQEKNLPPESESMHGNDTLDLKKLLRPVVTKLLSTIYLVSLSGKNTHGKRSKKKFPSF